MALTPPPKLVLDPEVRAIIDLDPGDILRSLKNHVADAAKRFAGGAKSSFTTTCRWHGQPVFITTSLRGLTRTTRISFRKPSTS